MAITLSASDAPSPPLSARLSPPQVWGIALLAPYLLVFLAFVVYPVGYGLWLARHPSSYVALYHDPIFARAAVNTLIFLVIGINIKMLIALFLFITAPVSARPCNSAAASGPASVASRSAKVSCARPGSAPRRKPR